MTPSEIITQEAQKVGYNADEMMRKIHKLVQSKAGILLQKNDTLMLIIALTKFSAEVHIFTIDDKNKLKESMKYFAKKLKSSKINKVYGTVEKQHNPILEQAFDFLNDADLKLQKSSLPGYDWMSILEGAK